MAIDGTLEEGVECGALQHAVLKQGKVDELVHDVVLGGKVGDDLLLLLLLLVDGLLGVGLVVLLLLGDLLRLLLLGLLVQGGQASLESLHLSLDGLQGFGQRGLCIVENAANQRMVAIEHHVH